MHLRSTVLASIICLLGAAFYMYEFTLQVSMSVMTKELMVDLSLNAATLGIVSSVFYYSYTAMQIPAGILHDRFGPRTVLTLAILTCSLGALFFSYSSNMWHASVGRFLMGIGSAFSFSGALLLISRWFQAKYFPILSGVVQLMSSIGAIFGVVPMAVAVGYWSWRPTMFYLSILGFLLAIAVWLIVRNFPNPEMQLAHKKEASYSSFSNFRLVFGKSQSWWIALYSFLIWAPITGFAGLWGIPFLVSAYQFSTTTASLFCTALWIGIGVSAPLIGFISEYIHKRCPVLIICALIGALASCGVIYFKLPFYILYLFLFLVGCAGSAQSLAFSVVKDNNLPNVLGAAIGLNNMATVLGGAIFQPLIGALLVYNATSVHYGIGDYRKALVMIPICYLLAALVSTKCIRETQCRSVAS